MKKSITGFDRELGVHEYRFDASDVPPSTAVVEAVLELEGEGPEEITPLYDVLDPDALDTLMDSRGVEGEPHQVSFDYEGYSIDVYADGRLQLVPNETR